MDAKNSLRQENKTRVLHEERVHLEASMLVPSVTSVAHLADHKKGETTQLNHSNMFIKNNKIQRKRRIGVKRQLTSCSAIWTVALRMCKLTINN